jgi:hypothetical protein
MGRRKKAPKTELVKVRMTEKELATLRDRAAQADCTISELVRARLSGCRPHRRADRAVRRDQLRHMTRIGVNLNQIARWVNTYKGKMDAINVCWHLERLREDVEKLLEQQESD